MEFGLWLKSTVANNRVSPNNTTHQKSWQKWPKTNYRAILTKVEPKFLLLSVLIQFKIRLLIIENICVTQNVIKPINNTPGSICLQMLKSRNKLPRLIEQLLSKTETGSLSRSRIEGDPKLLCNYFIKVYFTRTFKRTLRFTNESNYLM